jgi:hypothetical protein
MATLQLPRLSQWRAGYGIDPTKIAMHQAVRSVSFSSDGCALAFSPSVNSPTRRDGLQFSGVARMLRTTVLSLALGPAPHSVARRREPRHLAADIDATRMAAAIDATRILRPASLASIPKICRCH